MGDDLVDGHGTGEEPGLDHDLLDALTQVSRALLAGAEPFAVLTLIAHRAAELVGAEAACIMIPDADGRDLEIVAAHGPIGEVMPLRYPIEGSVSGTAFATGHAQLVDDARADARAYRHMPGRFETGPAALVPLAGGATPIGVLSVVNGQGGRVFTEADVVTIQSFAGHAALTLELARAREEVERLRVFEERERIARDLHDTVIQRLYATGMTLQSLAGHVGGDALEERLRRAVDEIDATIGEIRTTIFALGAGRRAEPSVRAELLALVQQAAAQGGWEPSVRFEGPVDSVVPEGSLADLFACAREALSNAVRHSGARTVMVELSVTADTVRLRITDDGRGIPAGVTRRSGLENLERRAARLGGKCLVTTRPGKGTTVDWSIPA